MIHIKSSCVPGDCLESYKVKEMQKGIEFSVCCITRAQVSRSAFRPIDLLPCLNISDYPGETIGVSISKMIADAGKIRAAQTNYKFPKEERYADCIDDDFYSGIASLF